MKSLAFPPNAAKRVVITAAMQGCMADVPAHLILTMYSLLRGEQPDAQVALLCGFFSTSLRDELDELGFYVITCDYRHSQGPGMHYRGDVRDILQARVEYGLFL